MQGVAVVRFTLEMSQWDPEMFVRTVLVEWLHVVEVWVGANFLFGHERAGTFTVLRSARRALRVPRREDRPRPLQGLRRQQHARPPAGCRGAGRRGGRAARAPLLHRRDRACAAPAAAARSGFRPRTSRPATSWCRRPASTRPRPRSTASSPVGDEHRDAPDVRRVGRGDRSRRTSSTRTGTCTTPRLRLSFVQRLRDERAFPDVDALRAQIEADCRGARRLFGRISL